MKVIQWNCWNCTQPFGFSESFFEESTQVQNHTSDSETDAEQTSTLSAINQLRHNYRKECIIANLNINSLPNKFVEIREWLCSKVFDILSIQETKIDRTFPYSQFQVDGYKLFRRDRVKGGGGIAVYISECITATTTKVTGKSVESLLLDLRIGQRQFALVSVYKPPSVDNNTFTSELSKTLDQATLISQNLVCIGDLNCDLLHPLDNNKQGKCLLDICDVYDLDSLVNKPTRISQNKESCLDVILTNVPAFMKNSGVIDTGLSDHNLVYTVLNTKLLRPKAEKVIKRSFKSFNQEAFLEDLSNVPFSAAYIFDDIDDVYWCWENLYNQVLDDHAPVRSFKRRPLIGSQFITRDIRHAMRERDSLKKKYS